MTIDKLIEIESVFDGISCGEKGMLSTIIIVVALAMGDHNVRSYPDASQSITARIQRIRHTSHMVVGRRSATSSPRQSSNFRRWPK